MTLKQTKNPLPIWQRIFLGRGSLVNLLDSPIPTDKIADAAVTLSKLGGDVADKLNEYATKADVATVGNIAAEAASAAADALSLADEAVNNAQTAINAANNAKETAENAQTAVSGTVRYNASQELTVAQMEQVAANVGVPTVFMSETEFGKTLSDERFAQVIAASRVVVKYNAGYTKIFDSAAITATYYSFICPNTDATLYRILAYSDTKYIEILSYSIRDANAIRVVAQNFTSTQQAQGRTNIGAMANTPSGDPMHYMYETAGAEWIPYADISTEGLEDWQVKTLDTAQAQADGGVWWHNDIFVTVAQNRINYVSTIGDYPANQAAYDYYLKNTPATTNYKQSIALTNSKSAVEAIRVSNTIRTVLLPNMKVNNIGYAINNCPQLRRIIGDIDVSAISSFNHAFEGCGNLRDISLKGLNAGVDFSGTPNLSMTSLEYAITNAGTATLTITLTPAVYAAAMADADVQVAQAAKTNVTLADAGGSSGGN